MSASAAQLVLSTPLAEQYTGWPYIMAISPTGHAYRAMANESTAPSFRWSVSWGYSEVCARADEGITWIRGWHDRDSLEVNALKTAFALKEKR